MIKENQTNNKISKRLRFFFFLFFISLILLVGDFCWAETSLFKSYYYDSIEVDIQIDQDSTFLITEKQTYNLDGSFGYFFREIALKNLDHISDIEVFDSEGKKLNKSEYEVSSEMGRKSIRWDFSRRIFNNELKSWTIKYKVHGGLRFFEGHDEFYWNAIFEDREVPVKRAEVIVYLPKEFNKENISQRLFIGPLESKNESSNYEIVDEKTVRFWGEDIPPRYFLTTVVAWPKGVVIKPFLYRNQIVNWIILLFSLILPIFVFFKMFFKWKDEGRDFKIDKIIIAQYSPLEDLPPAIAGVLINQKVRVKDITATIIDLAVRGYLKIKEGKKGFWIFKEKEYIFEKLKEVEGLNPFEQRIMNGIFKSHKLVSSTSLKNRFYKSINGIKKAIHQEVKEKEYFTGDIQKLKGKSVSAAITFIVLLFILIITIPISEIFSLSFIPFLMIFFSLFVSLIVYIVFSHNMPALSQKGAQAKWQSLGFKEYLHTAERFRLGVETVETFSKFLPYAIVFGVEKQWSKRFADLEYQQPDWYVGTSFAGKGGPISFDNLSSDISSFGSSISQSFSGGASGMGGGGGAGGGGGGGGGGGAG